jgi:hypothetical protein
MRKRARPLAARFWHLPNISNASQAMSSVVQLTSPSIILSTPSMQSLQGTSLSRVASANEVVELSIQKHLDKITDAEIGGFRDVEKTIEEEKSLSKARSMMKPINRLHQSDLKLSTLQSS